MEQALLYHARSLTVAVDREVETSLAGLKGLATSGDLDSADPRRFYEQARRLGGLSAVADGGPRRWFGPAGAQPPAPAGSPLPTWPISSPFRRTLETGEPQVSDLVMGPTAGRRVIAVTLPLLRDGKVRQILVAVMTPESFTSVLTAAQLAGGTVGTIVDRKGVVVATTEAPDRRAGGQARARRLPPARARGGGVRRGHARRIARVHRGQPRRSRIRHGEHRGPE